MKKQSPELFKEIENKPGEIMEVYPMEITGNKAQVAKDGKTVIQEVKYSDPYEEVKVRLQRKGNKVKVTSIEDKKK